MEPFKSVIRKLVGQPTGGSVVSQWIASKVYDKTDLLDLFSGYVYDSITAITDMVSGATFYVEQVNRKTGDTVEVKNHPFTKLLNTPNSLDTQRTLLEGLYTDYKMFGEFFIVVTRGENTNLPLELDKVHPINMQEVVDRDTGELTGWKYRGYRGVLVPLNRDEVIHVKGYNPRNRYRGWGALQAALNYVLTEKYGTQFTYNFLENNAIPGGVFSVKKDMTADAFKKLEAQFRQKYQGTGNAGKVLLIKNSEATFEKLGSTLSDVGLKDLKEITSESILNMFKVPKQELGIPDNINLATSRELARGFARRVQYDIERLTDAVQPLMDEYAKIVNRVRTNKIEYRLRYESIVPEDTELKLKVVESGLRNGFLTVNEAREMVPFGLNPIDNGDTVYQPSYLMSNGVNAPVGSPQKPKQKTPARITVTHKKKKKKVKELPAGSDVTLDQFNQYRRDKWKAMKPYVKRFDEALGSFYKSQYENMVHDNDLSLDLTVEMKRFKSVTAPILKELAQKQYDVAMVLDTKGKAVKQADQATVDNYIDHRLGLFAESSLGGINEKLKELLKRASSEDWSADETATNLRKLYGDVTDTKLYMIARTELNAAANYGAKLAYQDMGYTYKVWFANPDACPDCAELDGQVASIDEPYLDKGAELGTGFVNKFDPVGEPPLHPNCRCDVTPASMPSSPFDFPKFEDREDVASLAGV